MEKDEMIILSESNAKSIISDLVTFGFLIGSFWFNNQFLGNGIILQIVLGILFYIILASRSAGKVKRLEGREEILKFLEEYKDKQ